MEPPPWAATTRTTASGYVTTEIGCATSTSAAGLDAFFAERVGPIIGHDYQHVYPLGGDRYLWLFQDTFVDHAGSADHLGEASFAHNTAMVQDGGCFTLYHRGTPSDPSSFEPGIGETPLKRWFWPMGGELEGGTLHVFWVEMSYDGVQPAPGDGLGWVPARTWLASYDAASMTRLGFRLAPNSGVSPIYGYAAASDGDSTYLFGNSFDQNLARQGGFFGGPHSATTMWLARVPRGQLSASPEYRTATGWSAQPSDAVPIVERFWAENPMQPRHVGGQWVAATKVDGYWGDDVVIDVAAAPWGPWTTVARHPAVPRGGDPLMNTYHAHLMPWQRDGRLVVSLSQNARDMLRDAWPQPSRYRPQFFSAALVQPPPTTTTTTTTEQSTTTTTAGTSTTTTIEPSTTTTPTTTTLPPTTTTAPPTSTTTAPSTTTTDPPTTTTTTPTTTTTTPPPTTASTISTTTTVPGRGRTVWDVVSEDVTWLRDEIERAELRGVLDDGHRSLTLLAPSRAVFESFAAAPDGEAVVNDHERLRDLLERHLVDDARSSEAIFTTDTLTTMGGDDLHVDPTRETIEGAAISGGEEAANGYVHLIDRVISP